MSHRVRVWVRLGFALFILAAAVLILLPANQPGAQSHAQGTIQTVVLRQGEGGYTGCEDTYLSAYPPDAKRCGDDLMKIGNSQQYVGLIRFDVSAIPAHAVVTQATLQLNAVGWSGNDITIDVFRVLRNVEVCQADWVQARAGNPWGLPGAADPETDRHSVPETTVTTSGNRQWYELDLTELVQDWIRGSAVNNGVLLMPRPSADTFRFATSERWPIADRPALLIRFYTDAPPPSPTPPPTGERVATFQQGVNGYTGCEDTRISENLPDANFGEGELILGDRGGTGTLIRFDLSSIPFYATILESTLQLYVSNFGQRAPEPIICASYPVTRTWREMEATWNRATSLDYWGLPGCSDIYSDRSPTPTDQQSLFEIGRWYSWDVTSAARGWVRDPTSNKGILLQQTTPEIGGEYDIRESEYPGPEVRPRLVLRYLLIPPTPTNTPSPTPTNTPTPTSTPTVTPTPTPTLTPVPYQGWVYLPKVLKSPPLVCEQWGYTFREEFDSPALAGWSLSMAGGQHQVSDGIVQMWTQPSIDRFPMAWRNDVFAEAGSDFLFEARFRHSDFTAYGTTIALNSAVFGGVRFPAGESLPAGVEDILTIHHVVDPTGTVHRFDISMLSGQVVWNGTPGDTAWHIVRVTLEHGNAYTLYVDGLRVGSVQSTLRPKGIYIGNPTIQRTFGGWTHLYVDYVRVAHCEIWGFD